MRRTTRLACLQVTLLWGAGLAFSESAAPPVPAGAVAEETPLFASPTRLDRIGRVVAPVIINGRGPFRLVVDTGADRSTFSPALVEKLGLESSFDFPLLLNGVTGVASVPTVHVERLQAGDMLIENVYAPVVWSSIMADADGILGVAQLRRERMLVDFRNDRIVITRATSRVGTAGFIKIPARRLPGGLLQVRARVGGVSARVVIDTGAERTLGNLALRDALQEFARKRNRDAPWSNTFVFGATSEVAQGQSIVAPTIVMGPATVTGTEIVFGDFHIFKVWGLDREPAALIGMDVLGTVEALVFDFRRGEFYVDVTPPRGARTAARD